MQAPTRKLVLNQETLRQLTAGSRVNVFLNATADPGDPECLTPMTGSGVECTETDCFAYTCMSCVFC